MRRFFDEPYPEGGFEAVICVGNSLGIAEDLPHTRRQVWCMLGALRPALPTSNPKPTITTRRTIEAPAQM